MFDGLTVAELKALLVMWNIKPVGLKADLKAQVEAQMEGSLGG